MKSIKITEANQRFSKMIKDLEKEKYMIITKQNEPAYVIMKHDEYLRMKGDYMTEKLNNGIYGTNGNGAFYRIKAENGLVTVCEYEKAKDGYEGDLFRKTTAAKKDIEINGNVFKIKRFKSMTSIDMDWLDPDMLDDGEDKAILEEAKMLSEKSLNQDDFEQIEVEYEI